MKYYSVIQDIEKEAAIKLPKIQAPKQKWSKMSPGKKLGTGVGVASTAMAVGGAAIDAGKEVFKPIDKSDINTGYQNGLMKIEPMKKAASSNYNSLENSKMKYMPHVLGVAGLGLVGAGVATGRMDKDLLVKEGKKYAKKASKVYGAGSQIVSEAHKLAKKTKTDKELKAMMEDYVANVGNTLIDLETFKEIKGEYDKWTKRTGNLNNVGFEDWARKNAGKIRSNINKPGVDGKGRKMPFGKLIKQKGETAFDAALAGATFSGAASAANFVVHEVGDEYFKKKDKDEARKKFRKDWDDNFADHLVKGKPIRRKDNYSGKKGYKPRYINKTASSPLGDFVNHADDVVNSVNKAKRLKGKSLIKDVIKNDIVKPAVTGVAYIGAPALIASSIKRDRNTLKKIEDTKTDRVVIDIPEDKINKKASYREKILSNAKKVKADYIPDRLGEEFVRAGLRGTAMAAPVAVISNKINRNLRGNMEKLEDKNKTLKPVDKGNVRITLERRTDNV